MSSPTDHGSIEKTTDGHVENREVGTVTPPRRTFGQKLKHFVKRFWWALLIVFILGTLLVSLLIVYVGFPHIAQSGADDATLNVVSLEISNPTETSFHMKQVSQLNTSSIYQPWVDPFNATLALEGDAGYCQITIPGTRSQSSVTVTIDQDVPISNLTAFTDYNTALLGSPSIQTSFNGQATLHLGALPATTVSYNKLVTMTGFNGLKGFEVLTFQIKTIPDADGTNMNGTVYIPNPSVITVAMGNVTMSLSVKGTFIGTSTLSDLVLRPGNNTIFMTSIVNQTAVLDFVTTTYKDAKLPVDIVANSSVYNGVHLTYFEEALASAPQSIILPLCAAFKSIGLALACTP